jgi:hypothetical protein
MVRLVLALAVAALCLTGCMTPKYTWHKADMSNFERDKFECERDTRQAMNSFATRAEAIDFAIRCMESKGYTGTRIN